ncbi:glucans biosynthesis protein G [Methylogaea oryzae]|uniref:Glucans biosynthesis protein G n=2 Tax=Methylogaea oryzae TaxID=1295382 RepID=A0A8D4VR62_9GAMM|nr:glucans biosynthesis protein G [Methylogaea oryzae]
MAFAQPREDAHKGEAANPSSPFGMGELEQRAKKLAAKPFTKDEGDLPDFLSNMDSEHYRDIHFKPEKSLWREERLPFQVQLFHRGYMYKDRVAVNLVSGGQVQPVPYSSDFFDFGQNLFPAAPPPTVSYAGVRFHYPLRKGDGQEDVAVFLGASAFRAVGMGQVYGLSARGLAIDTGLPKAEEVPVFKEFWVEKPAPNADKLTVYALLDSPSATGAFRFVLRPGLATTIDVNSRVYFRKNVDRLGVAPLTSMYFHGENTDRFIDDFRPEVHDSDGLLMARNSGEWTWRSLNNPRQLRISVLKDISPKGFGLMQRDRAFDHYQDLDARYQQRSSLWVEPLGDWGAGSVYLIEIPSEAEKYDNIVAFWVSDQPALKGQERVFNYRLHYLLDSSLEPDGGRVVSTRVGLQAAGSNKRRFAVDFVGDELKYFSDKAAVEAELSASSGKISDVAVTRNSETGGWRLSFVLEPAVDKDVVDLRAYLKSGGEVLSETWLYQWSAK